MGDAGSFGRFFFGRTAAFPVVGLLSSDPERAGVASVDLEYADRAWCGYSWPKNYFATGRNDGFEYLEGFAGSARRQNG